MKRRDPKTMAPWLLMLAVLSIGLQDSAASAISPAIASICASYPNIDPSVIQLMVTFPSLAICIMSPLYGYLTTRIAPRKLILFGLVMFVAGGMLPLIIDSLPLILFCRIILGIGAGITLPGAISIIPVFYDGQRKNNMLGWNMTVGSFGCIFMQAVGGFGAEVNWHLSFLGYIIGVYSLIITFLFLPDIPKSVVVDNEGRTKNSVLAMLKKIPAAGYGELILYFIVTVFMTMLTSNLSLYIEGEQIGTASATGLGLSIYMAGALVGSAGFGFLKKRMNYYVIPLSWLILGCGYYFVTLSSTISTLYAALLLSGVGVGIIVPGYYGRLEELSDTSVAAFATGLVASVQGIATFLNPVVGSWFVIYAGFRYGKSLIVLDAAALAAGAVIIAVGRTAVKKKQIGE